MSKTTSQVTVYLTKKDEELLDEAKKRTHVDETSAVFKIALRTLAEREKE